jgi:hypothetical protein
VAKEFQKALEFDAADCGGWMGRHGGTVEYLGDVLAGPSGQGVEATAWVFALLFLGLMGALGRQAWAAAPAARAPAKAVVVKGKRVRARRSRA